MSDPFYLGYDDSMPPSLARFLRRVVLGLAFVVVVVVAAVAASQSPAEPGEYEFGVEKPFEGVLMEEPIPLLQVGSGIGSITNYVLVGSGKFGLPTFARGHGGQRVRLNGSLIHKGDQQMIELNDEKSFSVASDKQETGKVVVGVQTTLSGELVDTKCYFGVMRPGAGKVHRGCAARCLHGGVPPGLLLRDTAGRSVVVLLAGVDGKKLEFDTEWAARWVKATGQLSVRENLPILAVERLELMEGP